MPRAHTFAALLVLSALSPFAASAQSNDGNYDATIRCTALPSTNIGAFSQKMSLAIARGQITGERNVGVAGQVGAGGVTERWSGAVSPDGSVSAMSDSASSRAPIQGTFNRKVAAGDLRLTGTQTSTAARGGAKSTRDCAVTAKRG